LRRRPLLVTIVSILFVFAGIVEIGSFLFVFFPSASRPDTLYGYRIGFLGVTIFNELIGVYAIVQGYGLWKMKTWSWWLYVVYALSHIIIYVYAVLIIIPILLGPHVLNVPPFGALGFVAFAVFLGYMIMRRDQFNVKMPRPTTKRK
jgi:hypothetical protein